MTQDEKQDHPWTCNQARGDKQCPYVTRHGDDGYLNCRWKEGHPAEWGHQTHSGGDGAKHGWVLGDGAVSQIAGMEKHLTQIARAVREWICPRCRTVFPGAPEKGCLSIPCTRCAEPTVPLYAYEMAQAQQFKSRLAEMLAEPETGSGLGRLEERILCRVGEVLRERTDARSGEHEAYTQVADLHAQLDRTRQERDEVVAVAAEIRKSCADLRLRVRDLEEDFARSRREGAALRQQAEASGSVRDALAGAERRGQIA